MSRDTDNLGVPLRSYREIDANVLLTCLDCLLHRSLDREKVINRLVARSLGGPETGIRAVASFVEEPCPRCGGRRFESRPDFKAASGQGLGS